MEDEIIIWMIEREKEEEFWLEKVTATTGGRVAVAVGACGGAGLTASGERGKSVLSTDWECY